MTDSFDLSGGGLRFLAIPPSDLGLALEVRRQVYVADSGYAVDAILNDEFDARSQHFVALAADGSPVASMRILSSANRPFEFERFIAVPELNNNAGNSPAEISRLCVLKEYRTIARGQFVHAGMWKLALDYAAISTIGEFWIWTEPAIARVYSFLGFTAVRELQFFHEVLRKTYHLMYLSLNSSSQPRLPQKRTFRL